MTEHILIGTHPGKLGVYCSCGKKFPVESAAEDHVEQENKSQETKPLTQKEPEQNTKVEHESEPGEWPAKTDDKVDAKEGPYEHTLAPIGEDNPPHPGITIDRKTDIEQRVAEKAKAEPQPSELAAAPEKQELKPGDMPLDLAHMTLNQINFIGKTMAASGMFPDTKDAAAALTKILAGQEIGVTPFQALTNIHIIQGKATMAANLMAAKVKGSGKYDYRVKKQTPEECSIDFYEIIGTKREFIGNSSFTIAEAKAAGTQNLQKFPRNMLFARAMSNGTKWYTPDVFNGNLVYLPEELGAAVDQDGAVLNG